MKIETNRLTGVELDWAVAKCEGEEVRLEKGQLEALWTDNGYKPSTNWAQAGPIIEREGISLDYIGVGEDIRVQAWHATKWLADDLVSSGSGPTPLVAAMRCYVASKLGEEVEVHDALGV